MIDTLQVLRALNHETFTSGAQIADALKVSRACVSQALRRAENYGVVLQRRVGVGYRLSQPIDWLDRQKILTLLGPVAQHYTVTVVPETMSTNAALFKNSQAPHGQVLATEWQWQGKGRQGRVWHGAVGDSLMFSVKLVFAHGITRLSGLSLAVGVAIIRALHSENIHGVALKWPNDIVCTQGKVGGVLVEVSGDALGPGEVVIGIGLNCRLPGLAGDIQPYSDLQSLGSQGDRNVLLAGLLKHLYEVLSLFRQQGFAPFVAEWQGMHLWQDKPVNLLRNGQVFVSGKVAGITPEGFLRLQVDGQEQIFFSGDISLRGQA